MSDLSDTLRSGRVLVMDGAMGTELLRAGWPVQGGFERLNRDAPDAVRAIHRAYAAAGAEVLLTNTFQAWRAELSRGESIGARYAAAIRLARDAAPEAVILADMGPTPTFDAGDLLQGCQGADGMLADGMLLETWSDPALAAEIADVLRRSAPRMPLLVSFVFRRGPEGALSTFRDVTPEQCARAMSAAGIAALGVNCGIDIGREELLDIVRRYRSVTELPLFAKPNAGSPRTVAGDSATVDHPRTPEEMAAWLPDLFEAGVAMIGGCCGTTPKHIAGFRNVVDGWNKRTR